MNKYLEKIAAQKKKGKLPPKKVLKPIKHSGKSKAFVSLKSKVKIPKTHGMTNGK